MGHRPLARRGIILDRQALALVRQVLESAGIHGLADLALDEALPGMAGLPTAIGIASLRTHDGMLARPRQAS